MRLMGVVMAIWVISMGQTPTAMEIVGQKLPDGEWEDVPSYEDIHKDALLKVDRMVSSQMTGADTMSLANPRMRLGPLDQDAGGQRRPMFIAAATMFAQMVVPVPEDNWIKKGAEQFYSKIIRPGEAGMKLAERRV